MKKSLIALLILTTVLQLQAQTPKKQLGWDDIESWRRITETVLSNDGNFVAYKSEPWLGDPVVKVYDKKGVEKGSWISASGVRFTDDSKHLLFTVKPSYEKVRELKMSKAKREDMPPDTLMIWSVDGKVEKIPGIRSFDVLSKKGNWIAYQAEPSKKTTEGQPEKKESAANGYTLYLKELNTGKLISIPFVTQYKFSTVGEIAYFVSTGDNDKLAAGLYVYDFIKGEQRAIKEGKGDYRQVTFNTTASSIAFLFNGNDTDMLLNSFTLWYGPLSGMAVEIGKKGSLPIPTGWIISPYGRVSFSDSGARLFFATAPEVRQKDTTRLEEDVPNVDIWHWNEPVLHTQQVVDRNADARASYMAVYNIESGTFAQLATPEVPDITLIKKGDYNLALAVSTLPYSVESMWEATPGRSDVYFIDLNSGKKELIKKGFRGRIQPSPEGKYLYWYAIGDSSWYSISLSDKREFRLTTPSNIMAADETNDIPNPASSYSTAGWVTDDKAILLYDRYHIWKVDPQNGYAPVRVTTDGREKSIVYRVIKLDSEKTSFDAAEDLFLSGHNDITRGEGYYTITLTKPGIPSVVLSGLYSLTTPQKASDANTVVFAKQTFQTFPDLLLTDVGFKKHIKISDVNPQQNDFSWGTAEVVSWVSLDGMEIEGSFSSLTTSTRQRSIL